jgi:uncharacterized protein (UPF0548 family)
MFLLRKPSVLAIRAFLDMQAGLNLTYQAVGATAADPPPGCDQDHTRIQLGAGRSTFTAARAALQRWEHFCLGWVEPCWPNTPIEPGQVVAILARVCGLWCLNACRIVYVVSEDEPLKRFGFAYGTLPEHVESGEERFTIEWHQKDDSVWYDIVAFSRPNHLLVRLGYPLERRFARDSAAAMVRAATGKTPRAECLQTGLRNRPVRPRDQ